jgi:hypothetical protein
MEPRYFFQQEGSGFDTNFLVLDAQTGQEIYRFASLEVAKEKKAYASGCKGYAGWGCLAGIVGLFTGEIDLDSEGSGNAPTPRKWELRRTDGSAVFQLQKIRQGFDILRTGSSIGRIEWKKFKKIVNHQLILGDHLLATEVPTGLFRNEIHLEMKSGRLATLKNTHSMTSTRYGELFIKRELAEDELGLVLAVGLLWL